MKSSLNGVFTRKEKNMNPKVMDNLRKINSEQAREMGKKSGEARRAKKTMQETCKALLDLALYTGSEVKTAEDVQALAELKGQNLSVGEAIAIAQIQKALKGDRNAADFVVANSGQKPADKVEVGMSIEDYVKNRKVKL